MAVSKSRIREILTEARDKMNDSGSHWTHHRLKRTKKNGEVQYCSVGAIFATTKDVDERAAAIETLAKGLCLSPRISRYYRQAYFGRDQIEGWNDTGNWEKVNKGFNKVIVKLLREENK